MGSETLPAQTGGAGYAGGGVRGGLQWSAVVCGGLRWSAVVCGEQVPPQHPSVWGDGLTPLSGCEAAAVQTLASF